MCSNLRKGEEDMKNMIQGIVIVDSLPGQIRLFWNYFLNNGGRQFLSLLVVIVSVAPFHLSIPYITKSSISRNDPCPCGSGKKYKDCCLK